MGSFRESPVYQEASSFLFARIDYERSATVPYQPLELHLGRMRRLLDLIGSPEVGLPVVHIAGTKGKGSTAAIIDALLRESGYRTGRYTSPHLQFVEERFALNEQICAPEIFVELINQLRPAVATLDEECRHQQIGGPTYFEITTALAFYYFALHSVDFAIVEVGLGGRLDSTNVCHPLVSVITSISFDHMLQLGNTLPAIAGEKAGIIKPHIPVISGVTASEARQTIARIAVERQAPCFEIDRHFRCRYRPGTRYQPGSDGTLHAPPPPAAAEIRPPSLDYEVADVPAWRTVYDGVELGMWGEHQARNAAVAIATVQRLPGVRLTEPALRRALRRVRCPARIEVIGRRPTMILDAAHNVASMEALVQVVAETFAGCRPIVLLATTSGKDIEGMLRVLLPAVQRLVCTQYVTNPRALAASQLYQVASAVRTELGLEVGIERRTDLPEALRLAQETAQADDIIIVTGSFFVAGEVATLLQAAVDR